MTYLMVAAEVGQPDAVSGNVPDAVMLVSMSGTQNVFSLNARNARNINNGIIRPTGYWSII